MAKDNTKTKKGFTIIEVVLVLAIAGLIFLMVFVALPALQRSQRDTQRRDDMARVLSQLAQYQANNSGNVPDSAATLTNFFTDYLKVGGDKFENPSTGTAYTSNFKACTSNECAPTTTPTDTGKIYYYTNATCEGEKPSYKSGARNVAITLKLEGAGTYCGHN